MSEHAKRRNYFIDRDFQGKFILKFCLIVIFGGILTAGLLYFLSRKSTTVSIVDSRVVVRTTADFLLPLLLQTVIVVAVMVGIAVAILSMLFSHKIAGPLYRFRKVMEKLEQGDFSSNFHIRNYDQFKDLADQLNAMIVSVRTRVNAAKDLVGKLKKKKNNISDEEIEELEKNINYFKV